MLSIVLQLLGYSRAAPPIVFNVSLFSKHWPSTDTQNHSILVIMMHTNFLSACLLYIQGLVSEISVFMMCLSFRKTDSVLPALVWFTINVRSRADTETVCVCHVCVC